MRVALKMMRPRCLSFLLHCRLHSSRHRGRLALETPLGWAGRTETVPSGDLGSYYSMSWKVFESAGCQCADMDTRSSSSITGEVRASQVMALGWVRANGVTAALRAKIEDGTGAQAGRKMGTSVTVQ